MHRFQSIGATLAILGLAVIIPSFYVLLKFREPRWKLEMNKYVGTQIRESLIALVPEDLHITRAERQQLASSEIYRELTGVFWEAVDQNPVLRAQKEHFYSNGIEYSTSIDLFLLCLFFGLCYSTAWLVIRDSFLLYPAVSLISVALIAKWIAIPRARREHLSLSAEQLELLEREMGVFVGDRFRQIVLGWRARGRPGAGSPADIPKNSAFWKEAKIGVPLLGLVVLALIIGQEFGLSLGAERAPEVKSDYVSTGKHHNLAAVVFVHGVFGTKDDTWLSTGRADNFPHLLATDPELKDKVDVFTFEYFTPESGAAPSIVDLANQLRGDLDDHHVFDDHKKVAFVAHSMGGIIVRLFLLNHQDRIAKVPMVFFYATPTNGSDLASLAKLASSNPQLRGMVPLESNDLLQSIQSSWLGSDQAKSIASHCGVETLPVFGVIVVTRSSATALCNREIDPFSANHIDIVKPLDRTDSRYTRFASALKKEVLNTNSSNGISEHPVASTTREDTSGGSIPGAQSSTSPPKNRLSVPTTSNVVGGNLPHPVLAVSRTAVTESADGSKLNVLIAIHNKSGFEAVASISVKVLFDGVVIRPDLPERRIALAPDDTAELSTDPQLSGEHAKAFLNRRGTFTVRVTAEYADQGKTTVYTFEGQAEPGLGQLNITNSDWATKQ